MLHETAPTHTRSYMYNPMNQLIARDEEGNASSTIFEYDKRGNRIREKAKRSDEIVREFLYDASNRMVSGANRRGDRSCYAYNGLGMRLSRSAERDSGKAECREYVLDFTSRRNDDLGVYAEGFFTQNYAYANSQRIIQTTAAWEDSLEMNTPSVPASVCGELYIHEDIMGSARRFSGADGAVYSEIEYDVWGLPVTRGGEGVKENASALNPRYTNHTYDDTLGMYHAQHRFFDGDNRGFMQVDPVKDKLNWYGYCGGNPASLIDPLGLIGEFFSGIFEAIGDFFSGLFGGSSKNGSPSPSMSPTSTPTPSPTAAPSSTRIPTPTPAPYGGYYQELLCDANLKAIYNLIDASDIPGKNMAERIKALYERPTVEVLARMLVAEQGIYVERAEQNKIVLSLLNRLMNETEFKRVGNELNMNMSTVNDATLHKILFGLNQYTSISPDKITVDGKKVVIKDARKETDRNFPSNSFAAYNTTSYYLSQTDADKVWEEAKWRATYLYAIIGDRSREAIMEDPHYKGMDWDQIVDEIREVLSECKIPGGGTVMSDEITTEDSFIGNGVTNKFYTY